MQVINEVLSLPQADGEWIMSTMPNQFAIVLKNDTDLLRDYDRLAVIATVGEKVGESSDPNKGRFMVSIKGLRSVVGIEPGEELDNHPEAQQFFRTEGFEQRLTDALNLWAENTTEDQKMAIWMAGNPDPLSLLASILG